MDVKVIFIDSESVMFHNVLYMNYTYNHPELTLTIINDTVHVIDMLDVERVFMYEK